MKILVTGGTGVIGSAAVPALLRAGHEVRLLSRHADEDAPGFAGRVEPFVADLTNPDELARASEGCASVVHLAGIVEEEPPEVTFEKVNVEGTRLMLAAAERAGRPFFVFVSSLGAGDGESAYQKSKRAAEELVRGYEGEWLILRPGNVYGPGDDTISMLLKMVRSLPAVPVVAEGDQPFQPVWCADFAQVLVQAVTRRELAGQTLEVAGGDVTTTDEVLEQLSAITGREPARLSFPVWLTEVGVHALEAFGATGKKILRRAGLDAPMNSSKLTMLLERNVIAGPGRNALVEVFALEPTPLEEGLRRLADLLPEQLPGEGVGGVKFATFYAEIVGGRHAAAGLLDLVCGRIRDVMPIEFSAEPEAPASAAGPGQTLTARISGRGNVQVRLEERTRKEATFVTLEGHPLAGVMQLHADDTVEGVRFGVTIASQPANVFDWVAVHTIGSPLQMKNWRTVVENVVKLSGGEAPEGVQQDSRKLGEEELKALRERLERVVQENQRRQREELVAGREP